MKATLVTISLVLGFSFVAQAKLNDFNSLIAENSKAQNELHTDLKEKLNETMVAVQLEKRDRFLVDSVSDQSINVPTSKTFLTYSKEKGYFRPSDSQAKKRLAQEIDSAN